MTPETDDADSAATGPGGADEVPARLGRFVGLDKRPVNLDGFAERDDEAGLVAFASTNDPEPSVALDADGRVTELDGTPAAGFDLIDAFVAARGIDPAVAEEANATSPASSSRSAKPSRLTGRLSSAVKRPRRAGARSAPTGPVAALPASSASGVTISPSTQCSPCR